MTGIFYSAHPNRPLGTKQAARRGEQISTGNEGFWSLLSAGSQGCAGLCDTATDSLCMSEPGATSLAYEMA